MADDTLPLLDLALYDQDALGKAIFSEEHYRNLCRYQDGHAIPEMRIASKVPDCACALCTGQLDPR